MKRSLTDRFWEKVERGEGCWIWSAGVNENGYGMIIAGGTDRRVFLCHRLAWEMVNGTIPADTCVLHRCDNPRCVNPNHLFLGDRDANNKDRKNKGRGTKGVTVHTHRLTEESVIDMRDAYREGASFADLAREWNVAHHTAANAVRGVSWSHL